MKSLTRLLLLLVLAAAAPAALPPRPALAQDLFVSDLNSIFRFDAATGAPKPSAGNAGALFVSSIVAPTSSTSNFAFGPDGNLYVGTYDDLSVLRYSGQTGAFIDTFIPAGSGKLNRPTHLEFGMDGNLYVSSNALIGAESLYNSINRYAGPESETPGEPLPGGTHPGAIFIPGLVLGDPEQTIYPLRFTFGTDGDLYVEDVFPVMAGTGPPRIVRYDGETGAFLSSFLGPASTGADMNGLAFGADGRLYVAFGGQGIQRYDLAAQAWSSFVTPGALSFFDELAFGPDGHLYVSGMDADQNSLIARYDGQTGTYVDTFLSPGAGGWTRSGPLAFGYGLGSASPPAIPESGTLGLLALPAAIWGLRRRFADDRGRWRKTGERA
jgi:streptogramin lyase